MTRDKRLNRFLIVLTLWWLGSVLTYGNAVKEFKAEISLCEQQNRISKIYCGGDSARFDAFFASILGPQYWSETLWR